MASSYPKAKGRKENGHRFLAIPYVCLVHPNFTRLSAKGVKLFIDIAMQYNGKNNGDLVAAFSIMQKRGWKSKETLQLALLELIHYGWITKTRVGGMNKTPHLYAITFKAVDECGGKLDAKPTSFPNNLWKKEKNDWVKPKRYTKRFNKN